MDHTTRANGHFAAIANLPVNLKQSIEPQKTNVNALYFVAGITLGYLTSHCEVLVGKPANVVDDGWATPVVCRLCRREPTVSSNFVEFPPVTKNSLTATSCSRR